MVFQILLEKNRGNFINAFSCRDSESTWECSSLKTGASQGARPSSR